MAAYLKITGQALLEVFGRLPDAPRGAKSVEPGTEVCFRTVTKKIYDPLLYGKVNKRNCPKVESKTEYWVRKKRATKTGDLIRVLTKRGKDVGCVTDAEFFTRKYINGKLVRVELLTMIADKNGSRKKKDKGEYTIRVKCGEDSGAANYARGIVAWAFHRGSAPADYETFRAEGWEGDHLVSGELEVPLGRSSVICGWIKAETKARHAWVTRVRRAAVRLAEQGELYAAFVNERSAEKARKQKELDAAEKDLQKAKDQHRAKLRKLSGKTYKEKRAEALKLYKASQAQKEKIRAETEKRMETASPGLKKLWRDFVKKARPPEKKSQQSAERLAFIHSFGVVCICVFTSLS